MGMPSRARNCLGCGPAIRVPSPAAGRIANTCITRGVYIGWALDAAGIPGSWLPRSQNRDLGHPLGWKYKDAARVGHPATQCLYFLLCPTRLETMRRRVADCAVLQR